MVVLVSCIQFWSCHIFFYLCSLLYPVLVHCVHTAKRFPQTETKHSCYLNVYIWMHYDLNCLDTTVCLHTMTCFFECADSQFEWFSSSISAGLEKHGSLLWRLNTGLLLRLNLFICHPTIHWETGDRRGRWCCFRGTTAGVLQPNGHVFTFGCFLISHCNENST